MRLLLDTHTALWMFAGSPRIGPDLQSVLTDPSNEVFFSDASAWEIVIKHSLGKLPLPEGPDLWVPRMVEQHLLGSLPIQREALFRWGTLPPIHRDPFDRLLAAQADCSGCDLVTCDPVLNRYPIQTVWL